ncbi:hypothetical protein ACN47E_001965 [Coniothyrium glycines]
MHIRKRAEPQRLVAPYELRATEEFEGDDGKWSTFFINFGDSAGDGNGQNFRVLPSTSSRNTLLPQPAEWCDIDCAKSRGVGLSGGKQQRGLVTTKSWVEAGLHEMPKPEGWSAANVTTTWNSIPKGTLGIDNLGLGESTGEANSPVLPKQYIFGHTMKDFFFGLFGLGIGDAGPQGALEPSFLDGFFNADPPWIASLSYAYTAGAYYRSNGNGISGSLVLGGYDESRMASSGITIDMPFENNHTLKLGVQSMTWGANPDRDSNKHSLNLLAGAFPARIDSTLPYLILPDSVCDEIATRFQLGYDEVKGLYTVNASAYGWNHDLEATITFTISADVMNSSARTSIVLPYAALDHNLSFPIMDASTRYFPIKRSKDGVYVLGRTFLQEAYLIVDYNSTRFTVAPAYSSDAVGSKRIKNITALYDTPIISPPSKDPGLPAGTIAGIVVGIVLAFVAFGVGAFFFWKKNKNAKEKALHEENPSEIDTIYAATEGKYRRASELTGSDVTYSPKDHPHGYYGNPKTIPPISELPPDSPPSELYSPPGDGDSTHDYFVGGEVRRNGARRDRDSPGQRTPQTHIAELPGEDMQSSSTISFPGLKHTRGPSDTSPSTNIDEVIARQKTSKPQEQRPAVGPGEPATLDEIPSAEAGAQSHDAEHDTNVIPERRPSHTRGLSDTTVQSDSTAVSQPTPEELERWAASGEEGPQRPMSP